MKGGVSISVKITWPNCNIIFIIQPFNCYDWRLIIGVYDAGTIYMVFQKRTKNGLDYGIEPFL